MVNGGKNVEWKTKYFWNGVEKMLNDTLANALSKMLNAELRGKKECLVTPVSKVITKILEVMESKNYIGKPEVIKNPAGDVLKINLLGNINKCGAIKPRHPVKLEDFEKFEKRYLPAKSFGEIFISTSKGIMTLNEAREKQVGGKLLAYVY